MTLSKKSAMSEIIRRTLFSFSRSSVFSISSVSKPFPHILTHFFDFFTLTLLT